MIFSTLEMQIEQDNPVRFVDAFVDHLDLCQLGFVVSASKTISIQKHIDLLFLKH